MVDIYTNKQAFLSRKPKKLIIFIIFLILMFIIFLILAFKIKVYQSYLTKGYVTCRDKCYLVSAIPSNITYERISANNKDLELELVSEELKLDEENLISYYELTFVSPSEFSDQEIVELSFYYQKQRIITKLKEKMF